MIPCRRILLPVLAVAAAIPAFAGTGRYPITQEQIAAAIASGGMRVAPDQISLLSVVVARVAQPALQLKSVRPDGDRGMIARMECANPAQCVPFLVALHVNKVALSSAASQPDSGQFNSSPLLVHAGASAILLLEGAHVHISVPVICLENGSLGKTIRATSPDRHQSYNAQVAGERILRGRL